MPQTLYSGGPILSVNDSNDVVEAVLVEDGVIVAAGARGAVERRTRDDAVRVGLSGRTMIPGFIDPHGHFPDSGILALWRVNLAAPPLGDCLTVDMALERLAERVARTPKGEWVLGGMYDQLGVAERRFPTRDELDALSRDHPIYVSHFTGHAGVTVLALHPGWVRADMGGPEAPVTPEESAATVRKNIAATTFSDTGGFLDYDGALLPW
jgi:predicted amidohydrolase YtcJ